MLRHVMGVLVFAAAASSGGAAGADAFSWTAPVQLEGRGGLYAMAATPAFYAGVARADLADVRVRNGAGEAVPFALRSPAVPRTEAAPQVVLPIFPLWAAPGVEGGALSVRITQGTGGAIVGIDGAPRGPARPRLAGYVVDASAVSTGIDALHVEWAGTGFVGRVRVEASDDLERWTVRAFDAPLMALAHDGQTLALRRIAIPGTRAKYLRLTWSAAQETPALQAISAEPPPQQPERARIWQAADGAAQEAGRYTVDLGAHPPVDRLRIDLPMNAVMPVEVLSRDDTTAAWRPAGSSTLYRLERAGTVLSRDEVAFAPRADRYWMIRVDPRAGMTAGSLRVSAGYVPHEIVFAARGEPPFSLAFGDARAVATALPIATLVPGYRDGAPVEASAAVLGMPTPVARVPRRWPEWLDAERVDAKRVALWAILVAGVAGLGVLAWRLARQVS